MKWKWEFNKEYSFSDKRFAKIYNFFVLKTPIDNVSARGISFKKRNINLISLISNIKKISSSLGDNWQSETIKNLPNLLKEKNIYDEIGKVEEFAYHSLNEKLKLKKTESFFYCIRCAFAHGSFDIHKYKNCKYYILENKDNEKIKGRICLKEKTLIDIIDYVEMISSYK